MARGELWFGTWKRGLAVSYLFARLGSWAVVSIDSRLTENMAWLRTVLRLELSTIYKIQGLGRARDLWWSLVGVGGILLYLSRCKVL